MTLNTECRNAECRGYLNVMLSLIMLNVVVLSVVVMNVGAPVFSGATSFVIMTLSIAPEYWHTVYCFCYTECHPFYSNVYTVLISYRCAECRYDEYCGAYYARTSSIVNPGNHYRRGRLSTFGLLVLTSFDQLIFILKILPTFVTKQATLMRRSTVLSLPPQCSLVSHK
jgi:hypothetical protein